MNNEETFDVFMIGFNQKCDYLDLKEHTRRGFLMTTLSATENKIQLLPDRLVDEFKSIRERDLDYASTVDWLRRQDVIQLNNGIKKGSKTVKLIKNTNKDNIKDKEDAEPVKALVPRI